MAADKPEAVHIVYRLPCWISHRFRWNYRTVDIALWRRPLKTWTNSNNWNHVSTWYRSKVDDDKLVYKYFLFRGLHIGLRTWLYQMLISLQSWWVGETWLNVEIGRKIMVITATSAEIQTFPFLQINPLSQCHISTQTIISILNLECICIMLKQKDSTVTFY